MKNQQHEKGVHPDQDEQSPGHHQNNPVKSEKGRIKIEFYTDPLCCWSWAFEKPWRQLLNKYGDQVSYRHVMCGMIRDWNSYNDEMNSVSRPLQMGPLWMHASQVTHTKMRYDIWHLDPPFSSYPPCIAVKTVGLQSDHLADQYLFKIRERMMEGAANISRTEVLFSIAESIKGIDFEKFKRDWNAGLGKNPFREDMQKARFLGIGRFPTLTFTDDDGKGVIIVGYRPYEVLEQALNTILSHNQTA